MTDTRYLVHGVSWPARPDARSAAGGGASPFLRLQAPDGTFKEVTLDAGSRLGFRLAAEGKHCLGHHLVHGPSRRDHILCAKRAPAVRGNQCERCFVVDDSRLVHDFHRDGRVPPGLRSYLMQPHWLYVATFANGASKVGTAAELRKWQRLAEQGAVAGSYVAHAADGRVVRILEDLVTREARLPQQVRSAAKAAALSSPAPAGQLSRHNATLAASTRDVIARSGLEGFEVVNEAWSRPELASHLCSASPRHSYPHGLAAGSHGFTLHSLCGSFALATIDGTDVEFVVDLGQLKGRSIELGRYSSEVPAVQEALF